MTVVVSVTKTLLELITLEILLGIIIARCGMETVELALSRAKGTVVSVFVPQGTLELGLLAHLVVVLCIQAFLTDHVTVIWVMLVTLLGVLLLFYFLELVMRPLVLRFPL